VEAAGLLDERFFLYGEDIEWCVRVRQAGWSIGVCSGVRARHHEGSSATRTFGAHGTELRMAEGVVDAVRAVRGERYARAYASAVAMGLRIESVHPRRSKMRRDYVRGAARTWAGLAARRVR
jgi:GT2 family glycosyltransferase